MARRAELLHQQEGRIDGLPSTRRRATSSATARQIVEGLGGRYSLELGIALDTGGSAADEWFLAATLFGTRISAQTAMRTYRVLADSGIRTVTDSVHATYDDLVARLDAGGYARYDFRTATRLHQLADAVHQRFGGSVTSLARVTDPHAVETALDALPGWGPTTVRIFLRELRDVWPGAQAELDGRTVDAAAHLELPISPDGTNNIAALRAVARRAQVDPRDLEAALVRLALAHRDMRGCPGGPRCTMLAGGYSRAGRACLPIRTEHRS